MKKSQLIHWLQGEWPPLSGGGSRRSAEGGVAQPRMKNPRRHVGDSSILFLIVLLGLFLRIVASKTAPPGFTADEAVFGYNAYSILKTGRDEYGNFLPIYFRAFGDYRPPAYIYLTVPFIFLFGLNEFTTRLPSLLVTLLSILLIYRVSLLIFREKPVALFSSFFLAVSSWHILFSRMADMSNLSTFFIMLGVYFLFCWLKKDKNRFITFSLLSFVAAIYSYHNARVTVPLLLLSFFLFFWDRIKKNKRVLIHRLQGEAVGPTNVGLAQPRMKNPPASVLGEALIINSFLFFLFLLPLFFAFLKSPSQMLRRGIYQSFIHRGDIEARLQGDRHQDPPQQLPLITKFFHPRPFYLLKEFLRRYAQHFDFIYLFLKGDPHERFQIPGVGLLNLALLPFFLYGIYKLVQGKKRIYFFLLSWLLISPIVASQGINTPNSLHTFDSIMVYHLIIGFGFYGLLTDWQQVAILKKVISASLLLLVFFFYFYRFLNSYFYTIPRSHEYAHFWDYGIRAVVEKVGHWEKEYPQISFIGRVYYEFLIFYRKYPPAKYQNEAEINPLADKAGFEHVIKFNKYHFLRTWQEAEKIAGTLFIGDERAIPEETFFKLEDCSEKSEKLFLRIRDVIFFEDGMVAFRLFDIPENQEECKKDFCQKSR